MSAAPAKSILNSIRDLQTDLDRLTEVVSDLRAQVLESQEDEIPGSNADVVARLETLEAIIWGKE